MPLLPASALNAKIEIVSALWEMTISQAKNFELYPTKRFLFVLFFNLKSLKIRDFKQRSVTIGLTEFV